MAEETIIVEITEKVFGFNYGGKMHKPHDKVAIPKRLYRPDFMQLVAEVKVEGMKTMVTTPITPEVPAPEPQPEPVLPPQEEKPKTRKKGEK